MMLAAALKNPKPHNQRKPSHGIRHPTRPSVLNLSADEVEEIDRLIEAGLLPSDWLEQCCTHQKRVRP